MGLRSIVKKAISVVTSPFKQKPSLGALYLTPSEIQKAGGVTAPEYNIKSTGSGISGVTTSGNIQEVIKGSGGSGGSSSGGGGGTTQAQINQIQKDLTPTQSEISQASKSGGLSKIQKYQASRSDFYGNQIQSELNRIGNLNQLPNYQQNKIYNKIYEKYNKLYQRDVEEVYGETLKEQYKNYDIAPMSTTEGTKYNLTRKSSAPPIIEEVLIPKEQPKVTTLDLGLKGLDTLTLGYLTRRQLDKGQREVNKDVQEFNKKYANKDLTDEEYNSAVLEYQNLGERQSQIDETKAGVGGKVLKKTLELGSKGVDYLLKDVGIPIFSISTNKGVITGSIPEGKIEEILIPKESGRHGEILRDLIPTSNLDYLAVGVSTVINPIGTVGWKLAKAFKPELMELGQEIGKGDIAIGDWLIEFEKTHPSILDLQNPLIKQVKGERFGKVFQYGGKAIQGLPTLIPESDVGILGYTLLGGALESKQVPKIVKSLGLKGIGFESGVSALTEPDLTEQERYGQFLMSGLAFAGGIPEDVALFRKFRYRLQGTEKIKVGEFGIQEAKLDLGKEKVKKIDPLKAEIELTLDPTTLEFIPSQPEVFTGRIDPLKFLVEPSIKTKEVKISPKEYAKKLSEEGKLIYEEGVDLSKDVLGEYTREIVTTKSGESVKFFKIEINKIFDDAIKKNPSKRKKIEELRKKTIVHELIHYNTLRNIPEPLLTLEEFLPYKLQPSEMIAYGLEKKYTKEGFTIEKIDKVMKDKFNFKDEFEFPKVNKLQSKILYLTKKNEDIVSGSFAQQTLIKNSRPFKDLDILSKNPERLARILKDVLKNEIRIEKKTITDSPQGNFDIYKVFDKKGKHIVDIDPLQFAEEGFAQYLKPIEIKGLKLIPPEVRLLAKTLQQSRRTSIEKRLKIAKDLAQLTGRPELEYSPALLRGYGLTKAEQKVLFKGKELYLTHGGLGIIPAFGEKITLKEGDFYSTPSIVKEGKAFVRKSRMGLGKETEYASVLDLLRGEENIQFYPSAKNVVIEKARLKKGKIEIPDVSLTEIESVRRVPKEGTELKIQKRIKTILEGEPVEIAYVKEARPKSKSLKDELDLKDYLKKGKEQRQKTKVSKDESQLKDFLKEQEGKKVKPRREPSEKILRLPQPQGVRIKPRIKTREVLRDLRLDLERPTPRIPLRDVLRETPRDLPREPIRDIPRDILRDVPREPPRLPARIPPRRPERQPPKKPLLFRLRGKRQQEKPLGKESYNVFVKEPKLKKYVKITKKPVARKEAKNLLSYGIDASISRQGYLKKVKQKPSPLMYDIPPNYAKDTRNKFRIYKQKRGKKILLQQGRIIEKSKYMNDLRTEKEQLSIFRLMARLEKKKQSKMKIQKDRPIGLSVA